MESCCHAQHEERGYEGHITCTSPEASNASGGVGIFSKWQRGFHHCQPKTEGFRQIEQIGRATMAIIPIARSIPLLVITVHGWVRGDSEADKRARASAMMVQVMYEATQWPSMPMVITGDLNALTSELA